ncbi:hypothetical protein GCK72_002302 [Caenorhabditis remanei]|uniref:Uncharacterized protein n=1 Tax=Caenorhabditis remanei TaxID=31234 RepID=A0A6A5HVZ9_CAERE|nr:hypothetical protein GCK72_002302 [Caenorhabditis remanei]KAF1770483.1 hypothetical protein GCK72_002302 [Caenorhabditis remanei]
MTRSNDRVGSLPIKEANDIARKLTQYHHIDLTLPYRCEEDAASATKWIATFDEDDIVIQRKLCLICRRNPMDAFFKTHVAQNHPEYSPETSEIMRRLSDVRYSRFCQKGHISCDIIQESFPSISLVELINFLASLGFTLCRKQSSQLKPIDFDKKFEEPDIRGVRKSIALEVIKRIKSPTIQFLEELQFSAEVVSNSRMMDPSTQTTVHCHVCDKICNLKNFKRHMEVHKNNWVERFSDISLSEATEIFKRITDVRTALYYAAQPVRNTMIVKLSEDVAVQNKLTYFLLDSGFVVEDSSVETTRHPTESIKEKIVALDPNSRDMPSLLKYGMEENNLKEQEEAERDTPDLPSLEVFESEESESGSSLKSEYGSSRRRSSSVTSGNSSTSTSSSRSGINISPSSSPSEEPFPYCILNAIPEHLEVEHALYDLLEAMTDDPTFQLTQAQYGFLLGYTMYCLVVSNGSKHNVISRLTLGDFRAAKVDEQSGLHYFSFSTKTTCTQLDIREHICADERIWRALEIFEVARERRAAEMQWNVMNDDTAPFFFSYVSPNFILKDTNYWMSQFLRMCEIDWPCRSNAICSAAWSLVAKDAKKTEHPQYAITYFKLLREKERSQTQFLDNGISGHPTYRKVSTIVFSKVDRTKMTPNERSRKKQKRYMTPERVGKPNKPRGGDHKSKEFLIRTGRVISSDSEETQIKNQIKKQDSDDEPGTSEPLKREENEYSEHVNFDDTKSHWPDLSPSSHLAGNASSTVYPQYREVKVEGNLTMTCL